MDSDAPRDQCTLQVKREWLDWSADEGDDVCGQHKKNEVLEEGHFGWPALPGALPVHTRKDLMSPSLRCTVPLCLFNSRVQEWLALTTTAAMTPSSLQLLLPSLHRQQG